MLAIDEIINERHGAGAIESVHGDQVCDNGGLELDEELPHARGFKLEDADGLALGEYVIGGAIIQSDVFNVQLQPLGLEHFHRLINDREGPKTQEIHLKQAHLFQAVHVYLGGDIARFGVLVKGNIVGEVPRRDDHSRRMGRGMAVHPLQNPAKFEQILMDLVLRFDLCQGGVFAHGFFDGGFGIIGDHLGNPVGLAVGHPENPGHIPHHRFGLHFAKGDDLADSVLAILPLHVVDDLPPALLAEVDVDVGHRDAVGVEETFKQEVVVERINLGDAQAVGHQGAGRAAPPRPHRDVSAAGEADEIHDDEEIPCVAHTLDHPELHIQPFLALFGDHLPLFQALLGQPS